MGKGGLVEKCLAQGAGHHALTYSFPHTHPLRASTPSMREDLVTKMTKKPPSTSVTHYGPRHCSQLASCLMGLILLDCGPRAPRRQTRVINSITLILIRSLNCNSLHPARRRKHQILSILDSFDIGILHHCLHFRTLSVRSETS